MVDLSDPAAVKAEAQRRLQLRAEGFTTFDLAPQQYGNRGRGVEALLVAAGSEAPMAPKQKRGMNGTETRRSLELEALRIAGEIRAWHFEGITLKLADDCRYTPDFLVIENTGALRFEETKGHWRDDARVKIRVAADKYPHFTFVALRRRKKKEGSGWAREAF